MKNNNEFFMLVWIEFLRWKWRKNDKTSVKDLNVRTSKLREVDNSTAIPTKFSLSYQNPINPCYNCSFVSGPGERLTGHLNWNRSNTVLLGH